MNRRKMMWSNMGELQQLNMWGPCQQSVNDARRIPIDFGRQVGVRHWGSSATQALKNSIQKVTPCARSLGSWDSHVIYSVSIYLSIYLYIYLSIHPSIDRSIHPSIHTCMHACMQHACMRAYVHAYTHTFILDACIHTYMHTYIRTYIHACIYAHVFSCCCEGRCGRAVNSVHGQSVMTNVVAKTHTHIYVYIYTYVISIITFITFHLAAVCSCLCTRRSRPPRVQAATMPNP